MLTAVSVTVSGAVKVVLLARKYLVPPAVVRPPLAELISAPPAPLGLLLLMAIAMLPVVVAAAVEVRLSSVAPFQSRTRDEPVARLRLPAVVVRAVPSARLRIVPAPTLSAPVLGRAPAPERKSVPALRVVPPV